MNNYTIGDSNFAQSCNGLEIYHTVSLNEGYTDIKNGGVYIAKNVTIQIGHTIGKKCVEWSKDLAKEILTGK